MKTSVNQVQNELQALGVNVSREQIERWYKHFNLDLVFIQFKIDAGLKLTDSEKQYWFGQP